MIKYPHEDVYTLSVDEVLDAFQTDATAGISTAEAARRTQKFGANVYQAQQDKNIWLMIVQQFKSPIVYLLFFGAAVSLYFRDIVEAIAIGVVILVNALIGFLMELQARNSMKALREMDVIHSQVIRDGKVQEIPSEQLTPGDLVVLEAGDIIPGDGRLVEINQFQCDESSLTGESLPTEKNTAELPPKTALGDQFNMVFKGASVINGKGKAIITGIAAHTQLGKITSLVAGHKDSQTPLDKKLDALSQRLIWLTLVLTLLFAISGAIGGKSWVNILKTSIALAVAAFPEGLPIVATVALSYGMLQMARRHVIVKKLSSVETLGSTTVILTDKTGTLTENKIHVDTFAFPQESVKVHIEKSTLHFDDGAIVKSAENFEKLKLTGALCNNATVKSKGRSKKITGDPIEIALIHLADATDIPAAKLQQAYVRIGEIPFNSEAKIMGTLHKGPKAHFVAAKGSVEHLLEKCTRIQAGALINPLQNKEKNAVLKEAEKLSASGLRVLAFAYKEGGKPDKDDFLQDLIYIGCIGFVDPPRSDIKPSILSCRNAGIKIVMITGDHPMTALNIARQTGVVDQDDDTVIVGKDLPASKKITGKWEKMILETAVFARTTPEQKLDIASVFQKAGNIVAMTGDGVNDAPALKQADVGIAMGKRGTQVAKETASIVVKDDSFKSIVKAVAHGRVIFDNIQKFVIYLVSCNLSEIFIVTALGFAAPASSLVPLQILFLNMVTDVFPALALGLGDGDDLVMERPPRDPKQPIVSRKSWIAIASYAFVMTLAVIIAVFYCKLRLTTDAQVINNVAFLTLAFSQLFHVFNMASMQSGLLINEITKNKFVWLALVICTGLLVAVYAIPQLHKVMNLADLSGEAWAVSIIAGLIPLVVVQVYKIIARLVHAPS